MVMYYIGPNCKGPCNLILGHEEGGGGEEVGGL